MSNMSLLLKVDIK